MHKPVRQTADQRVIFAVENSASCHDRSLSNVQVLPEHSSISCTGPCPLLPAIHYPQPCQANSRSLCQSCRQEFIMTGGSGSAGEFGGHTASAGQGAHQPPGICRWPGAGPQHGPQVQGAQPAGPYSGPSLYLAVPPHPDPHWGLWRSVPTLSAAAVQYCFVVSLEVGCVGSLLMWLPVSVLVSLTVILRLYV